MMIQMDYQLELQYRAQDKSDFILNICPARTRSQRVSNESFVVEGATPTYTFTEPLTANRINRLYCEGGLVTIRYQSTVEIDHVLVDPATIDERPIRCIPSEVLQYMMPSRFCQADKLRNEATALFGSAKPGYARVASICDWVTQHVRFSPNATNSTACALETYASRIGGCKDYAHLMIAICRGLHIPARYVHSVDCGADSSQGQADFHASVEVFLGYRWYLFDPSGLSQILSLIRVGTGRDAADASVATVFGVVQRTRPKLKIQRLVKHEVEIDATLVTRNAISTASETMVYESASATPNQELTAQSASAMASSLIDRANPASSNFAQTA
jgi:transglutaminase-like putative cysteine protease